MILCLGLVIKSVPLDMRAVPRLSRSQDAELGVAAVGDILSDEAVRLCGYVKQLVSRGSNAAPCCRLNAKPVPACYLGDLLKQASSQRFTSAPQYYSLTRFQRANRI